MRYLNEKGIDITEPYQIDTTEPDIPHDKNQWTSELFFQKVEDLRLNFAYNKRVPELREISKVVFAKQKTKENLKSVPFNKEEKDVKSEKPFIELVNEKDIKGLRNYISSWFGLCPTLKGNKCDKYMNYLEKVGIDITEPYRMNISEKPTPKDRSQWTEALYFRKVEYLRLNFAYNERVPELKEMSKVVFAKQIAKEKLRRK